LKGTKFSSVYFDVLIALLPN